VDEVTPEEALEEGETKQPKTVAAAVWHLQDGVTAIFDRPMATVEGQDAGGISGVARMTGNAIDGLG
jgi:hypothetical protein